MAYADLTSPMPSNSQIIDSSIPILSGCNVTSDSGYNRLESITCYIRQYYIWVIFAFGFPGNVTSVIVVYKMSKRRLESSLCFVALLAVVDNIAIFLKLLENQAQNQRLLLNDISCQVLFFFGLTIVTYANWVLMVLALERFLAVRFPLKVSLIWTMKTSIGVAVCVFVFLCLVHLHIFWHVTSAGKYSCALLLEGIGYQFWFYIGSLLYAIIPASSFVILNILIIYTVRRSNARRKSLTKNAKPKTRLHHEYQITAMLVTVSAMFIVLSVPRCVFTITYDYWNTELCTFRQALKSFVNVFTSNFADTNHAVNFYLYFLSGRRFRQAYKSTFFKWVSRASKKSTSGTECPSDSRGRTARLTSRDAGQFVMQSQKLVDVDHK